MNYNPIDTLRIDTAIIQHFNDDKTFHYTAEKARETTSFDILSDNLGDILEKFFNALIPTQEIRDFVLYTFGIVFIVIVCFAIYRKFPHLFSFNKKMQVDDALKEENIQHCSSICKLCIYWARKNAFFGCQTKQLSNILTR